MQQFPLSDATVVLEDDEKRKRFTANDGMGMRRKKRSKSTYNVKGGGGLFQW